MWSDPEGSIKASVSGAFALPRHCSSALLEPAAALTRAKRETGDPRVPADSVLFDSGAVSIGRFRCPVGDPHFRDSGAIREAAVVVFPRTSVWIRHEGGRPFVADPNVVTLYNRAQRYERFAIDPAGDRCDWFALDELAARDLACEVGRDLGREPGGARTRDAEANAGPFRVARAPNTAALFSRQRALYNRARAGTLGALEGEEEVLAIVADVLRLAASTGVARSHGALGGEATSVRRRRDLAEAARAILAASVTENRSVTAIARALDASPFHLCRVFREQTGQTMHAYRVALRMRLAIERLSVPARRRAMTLSAVASEVGFASHAHFVRICRRELGVTPGRLRDLLRGEAQRLRS